MVRIIGVGYAGVGHLLGESFAIKPEGDNLAEYAKYAEGARLLRLIDPGSEFRFHREWYVRSAMGGELLVGR